MQTIACATRQPNAWHISTTARCVRTEASRRLFHTSSRRQDGLPNHYETLGLLPTATEKEIKKQFYTLSKAYHPDLHPKDPDASTRFVQISESYAVLSSADKRHIYDRDFARAHQKPNSSPAYPTGSFSSSSTPAGGRPASGLSRRRTQFRGPPPSFYRSGGWGEQGDKRSEHASRPSHSWESQAGAAESMPGTGPGGFAQGFENDVPHFDSKGHYQTHSTIERTRHKARRRMRVDTEQDAGSAGGMVFGFISVSGMLAVGFFISGTIMRQAETRTAEDKT